MANVLGLGGLTTSSGTEKLIAAYGNDFINVDTGAGFGINLTSTNDVNFSSFLDRLFFQNFNDTPKTFDGTSWTNLHVKKTPVAKYIKQFGTRMYLGHVKINSTTYASRVIYSDLPSIDGDGNQTIQWGIDYGTDGSVTANTNRFTSATAGFKTYGIKVGDKLVIESGANAGEYTVSKVVHDTRIDVLETFTTTQNSITFWVGSNWFDVRTNNSDVITWIEENNDRFLMFKNDSLHRYDGSSLRTIKGVPGTTSGRSVVNIGGATIYFHGSTRDKTGFYLYDGVTSRKISNKIQPFIEAISSANYASVVAWSEGNVYRAYVGTLTNKNSSNDAYNISQSNSIITYSVSDNTFSIDTSADAIKCAAYFRESAQTKTFLGDDGGQVFQANSGYSFNTVEIPFAAETKVIYPRGSEIMNVFTRLEIVARDASRVTVSYKLWDTPYEVDQEWRELGNLSRDLTEFNLPADRGRAKGIQLRFDEMSSKEPSPVIEKITLYSFAESLQNPEISRLP